MTRSANQLVRKLLDELSSPPATGWAARREKGRSRIQEHVASDARRHQFQGNLNVFTVQPQWEAAKGLLAIEAGWAEVDLSQVGDLDQSGVELIRKLDWLLGSRGVELRVSGIRAEWLDAFAHTGLGHLIRRNRP
jgi:ABC-type transporter Mla MlaB component